MATIEQKYPCACEHQIVWFFDEPIICVCPECERTYHFDVEKCPICDFPICQFVLSEDSKEDFYSRDDGG